MARMWIYSATIFLAAIFGACQKDSNCTSVKVSGKLTDAKTGQPLAGVSIRLVIGRTMKAPDDEPEHFTQDIWGKSDSIGHYFFEYEGVLEDAAVAPGSSREGYGGFPWIFLKLCEQNTVDVALQPYDSYLKIIGKSERPDTAFTSVRIWSADKDFKINAYSPVTFVDYYFKTPIETGQTSEIDSIPICGGFNYGIQKYSKPAFWPKPDTIFLPEGKTTIELKI